MRLEMSEIESHILCSSAVQIMERLHDALIGSGYCGQALERFLVRLLFCLFSDAIGIFLPQNLMRELLIQRTQTDGDDLGLWFSNLFETLNTPQDQRHSNLDKDLARFPCVKGALFAEKFPMPVFDADMRVFLLEACHFDWGTVSPILFGSLFQSLMNQQEKRTEGAYYTTEQIIFKVIEPLFLEELRWKFTALQKQKKQEQGNKESIYEKKLKKFHKDLTQLRFFDPACGCGNFLIIIYRELRLLEIDILQEIHDNTKPKPESGMLSRLDLSQFYGIELNNFPALIAETALWIMDHIMNLRLSHIFDTDFTHIPLQKSPNIRHADALDMEWSELIAPQDCDYVIGNPPFIGSKFQTPAQRAQVKRIARLGGSGGTLDYVAAWFIKAGAYAKVSKTKIGFVATSSITQGEQIGQLWPILFNHCQMEIIFAHRPFVWESEAQGQAHVYVVVIGLAHRGQAPKRKPLYANSSGETHMTISHTAAITPYLVDGEGLSNPHLVVREVANPLSDVPRLMMGSQPIDGGHYIFNAEQRAEFIAQEPAAEAWMRPFVGAAEYIKNKQRWILLLHGISQQELYHLPQVQTRIKAVQTFRAGRKSRSTQALASMPTCFNHTLIPIRPFLVIPEVNSMRRDYLPIGWLEPPVIPSNLLRILERATLWHFGILSSAMHMAWLRQIGGKLGAGCRYSSGVVYNSFPWPVATTAQKWQLSAYPQAILDIRNNYPDARLADLYNPDKMPDALQRAHQKLDQAVDRLYRHTSFTSDHDRIAHLFTRYEALMSRDDISVSGDIEASMRDHSC